MSSDITLRAMSSLVHGSYKTRKAIAQTVHDLESSLLSAPFEWYSDVFLRLTYAISRRQEFVADEVAARVVGAGVVASALRRCNATSRPITSTSSAMWRRCSGRGSFHRWPTGSTSSSVPLASKTFRAW